ncbi:MAG: hypothetical protein JOY61_24125 [Chloroflexi bacterium]|nr:hypothetical protein [Chloroflexota bacterium]
MGTLGTWGAYGTPEDTRAIAAWWAQVQRPDWREQFTRSGWVDDARLDAMVEAVLAWGERPDAFMAMLGVAAVGWVGEDGILSR